MSVLEIKSLKVVFSKGTPNEKAAIDGLSLSLGEGESVSVIGSNGAGKTTLQNAICGAAQVDSGSILLSGADITYLKAHKRYINIGRIFQDPLRGTAQSMTIEENLSLAYTRKSKGGLFALTKERRSVFRDWLSKLGMGLENRLTEKVGLLSGGQRQALSLVMAIIAEPKLLLLDEHTAALDPIAAEKVMGITESFIKSTGVAVMMVTHDVPLALSFGTRTVMMDSGKIIFDFGASQREGLTVEKLMKMYSVKASKELSDEGLLFNRGN